MATPMSPGTLVKVLRDAGLKVVEQPGWRDNNRNHKGAWGPVHGVMLHHTVTSGTASSVNLCFNGHSALPGPLCHGVIAKDGTVYMVGNGRANHAGLGDKDVLAAVIAEKPLPPDNGADVDGNRHFYGFECINLGDGKDPWPKAQVDAMIRASAAIARKHGWNERSVIGHLEWQPGKIDPRGPGWPGMDTARARIGAYIKEGFEPAPKPPTKPTPPKENPAVLRASLLARKETLTIPAGEDRKIYFTENDQYDDPNEHGAGGYTVLSTPATFTGTVYVHAPASVPGVEALNVVTWYENADGETGGSITQSVVTLPSPGSGAAWNAVSVTGVLPAGKKLVFGIRNSGSAALAVPRVDLRIVSTAR